MAKDLYDLVRHFSVVVPYLNKRQVVRDLERMLVKEVPIYLEISIFFEEQSIGITYAPPSFGCLNQVP